MKYGDIIKLFATTDSYVLLKVQGGKATPISSGTREAMNGKKAEMTSALEKRRIKFRVRKGIIDR